MKICQKHNCKMCYASNGKQYCKVCKSESDRTYRLNNKEKIKERQKIWNQENKDRLTQKAKEKYEENKEVLLTHQKEKYHKNKVLIYTTERFIDKSNQIHNFKYDYSQTAYKKVGEKVIIICPVHGNFSQKPSLHLQGYGCKKCGDGILSLSELKNKFNQIHQEKYDYSLIKNYTNNHTNLQIICPIHGMFKQTTATHLKGGGCQKCSRRLSQDKFIQRCEEKHHNKYDYSKFIYDGLHSKIEIICPNHGCFSQQAGNHLNGAGCRECAKENRFLTIDEFIEKSQLTHSHKYDYSQVNYTHSLNKVEIICHIHGSFWQNPQQHLLGSGCKKCNNAKLSNEEFKERAVKVWGNRFNYDLVNYNGTKLPIKIICKEHGVFEQTPNAFLSGRSGCYKCTNTIRYTNTSFIEALNKIHKNKYDYSLVEYNGSHCKIKIICNKHGIFMQMATNHLSGAGCPVCTSTTSKIETEWLDIFNLTIEQRQITLKSNSFKFKTKYRVDAYDQETNTVYEFLGDYWHGNPDKFKSNDINKKNNKTFGLLYKETIAKIDDLTQAGYKVIYIWQNDFIKSKKGNK